MNPIELEVHRERNATYHFLFGIFVEPLKAVFHHFKINIKKNQNSKF